MRFGPFPKQDLPKIEQTLTKAGLAFQVVPEEPILFIEISDEELEKVDLENPNPEMESLGFSLGLPVPDFHNQDFVCPKCELSQEMPGLCPKDGTALLEFSDFVQHQNQEKAPSNVVFYAVMGLVIVVVAVYSIWG